ncbi:glycerophosphodiester phosphodiesterase family protein [Paenibacillus sp. FSL H8-0034]|uniref:glycerophosphodiester phosphodiesterase family protein n=1 Tax=Paenibacillus sp. FSL H8-0034 TaxID=2954671 RepID=UPI0030F98125
MFVAAHRGLKSDYPENTLLAFQKVLESEVDMQIRGQIKNRELTDSVIDVEAITD